jgi:Bacterial Ig-like domain (group 3)
MVPSTRVNHQRHFNRRHKGEEPMPTPTGTVTIYNGTNAIAQATLSNGSYSVSNTQLSNLPVGSNSLTASYSGDANNSPSTSPVVIEVVNPLVDSTTISLAANPNPVTQGTQVTCSGTVTPS